MKTIILSLIAVAAFTTMLKAQEQPSAVKPVVVMEPVKPVELPESIKAEEPVLSNDTIEPSQAADTSIIRIGKKEIQVIENDQEEDHYWCHGNKRKKRNRNFDGHWEAIQLGFNGFDKADYSAYGGNEFMSLDQGKSMEVKVNFYELNISLVKSYVGLVSGMGLSFNSYRFENPYTLGRGPAGVEAIPLNPENLDKTKLAVSYLNVPLLLEFQIPVNQREGCIYLNAGVIGGVKIGSHTKVKYGDDKDKVRSGFHMNAFNYAATASIGYRDMGLFANYSLTPLFKEGKGPELTPFTIGISFSN